MGLSFRTARKKNRCFNTCLRVNKILNQDAAVMFGPDQPGHLAVPRAPWYIQFDTQKGGCDVRIFQPKTGRQNQSGSSLQYLSKKSEYAIPHRIDFPDCGPNLSRLPRFENKLLPLCSKQNTRSDTNRQAPESAFQLNAARCQITHTICKNNKVKKTSKVLSHITSTKKGLHNGYYANSVKSPTKNNTILLGQVSERQRRRAVTPLLKNTYAGSSPVLPTKEQTP